jgi:hypothetical protein
MRPNELERDHAELPLLTEEERREVVERAKALDEFSPEQLEMFEERLADYERDPKSWISLDELKAKYRNQGRL